MSCNITADVLDVACLVRHLDKSLGSLPKYLLHVLCIPLMFHVFLKLEVVPITHTEDIIDDSQNFKTDQNYAIDSVLNIEPT